MPLIIALVLAAAILAVVAWFASSGWLVRSALDDLARRRRLRAGTDPLQLTAQRAGDSALRSYQLARKGLLDTVDGWYELREKQGIDSPLADGFTEFRATADSDLRFQDLLDRAITACTDNAETAPDSVAELIAEAARMDTMTLEIRKYLHRDSPSDERPPSSTRRPWPKRRK